MFLKLYCSYKVIISSSKRERIFFCISILVALELIHLSKESPTISFTKNPSSTDVRKPSQINIFHPSLIETHLLPGCCWMMRKRKPLFSSIYVGKINFLPIFVEARINPIGPRWDVSVASYPKRYFLCGVLATSANTNTNPRPMWRRELRRISLPLARRAGGRVDCFYFVFLLPAS